MSGARSRAVPPGTSLLTATWVALLCLTVLNYLSGDGQFAEEPLVLDVLVAVFVKLGLVAAVFMGLRIQGTGWLRVALALFSVTLGLIALAWSFPTS